MQPGSWTRSNEVWRSCRRQGSSSMKTHLDSQDMSVDEAMKETLFQSSQGPRRMDKRRTGSMRKMATRAVRVCIGGHSRDRSITSGLPHFSARCAPSCAVRCVRGVRGRRRRTAGQERGRRLSHSRRDYPAPRSAGGEAENEQGRLQGRREMALISLDHAPTRGLCILSRSTRPLGFANSLRPLSPPSRPHLAHPLRSRNHHVGRRHAPQHPEAPHRPPRQARPQETARRPR